MASLMSLFEKLVTGELYLIIGAVCGHLNHFSLIQIFCAVIEPVVDPGFGQGGGQ